MFGSLFPYGTLTNLGSLDTFGTPSMIGSLPAPGAFK